MAIIGPNDLPVVLKMDSSPMKGYVLRKLGHPHVRVEIEESQFEHILRVTGDFISRYFPLQQRLAVFWTEPLRATYPMPSDAVWIQEVAWDSVVSRIDDLFGAEAYLFNSGNFLAGGMQGMILDYHLLQAYRKTAAKIMGTEGHWDVINEVDGDTTQQLIRLYPTPKGTFPVTVLYIPEMHQFRSVAAKEIAHRMLVAEAKQAVGHARRKISGFPGPGGGSIQTDGEQLVAEGKEEAKECVQDAIKQGEPLSIFVWAVLLCISMATIIKDLA